MASALSDQVQCSICLRAFTDPVSLPCEHSFCRLCIVELLKVSAGRSACPECRLLFNLDDLRPNRFLRNIVNVVKNQMKEEPTPTLQSQHQMDHDNACDLTCYEHDERLRLFCETDMTLVCVICRDGKDHQGHQFKPVNEVAPEKKDEVKNVLGLLTSESTELNDLVILQTAEMQNTKMKSKHLSEQISAQFEMMHKFLTKKKEEIKKHLEMEEMKLVKQMEEKKTMLETLLKEVKRDQEMFKTALDICKPDSFMQVT